MNQRLREVIREVARYERDGIGEAMAAAYEDGGSPTRKLLEDYSRYCALCDEHKKLTAPKEGDGANL